VFAALHSRGAGDGRPGDGDDAARAGFTL